MRAGTEGEKNRLGRNGPMPGRGGTSATSRKENQGGDTRAAGGAGVEGGRPIWI